MLTILLFLSGIAVSIIGATYSIIGLASLFAGAYWAVVTMGITLEIAKLVTVSWLYRNWELKLLPNPIRMYLTSAVLMLMFITSVGIFGFLSKAHLDQATPNTGNRLLVKNVERQIDSEKKSIEGAQKIIDQLDKALDKVIDRDADKGLSERQKQQNERNRANNIISNSSKKITDLSNQKLKLDKDQLAIDKDIGPFKYVAELIYGDSMDGNLDRAVRLVIICLILVFDPLAVLMLIAFNISIRENELNKKVNSKITYPEEKIKSKTELKKEEPISDSIVLNDISIDKTISKEDVKYLKKEDRHKLEGLSENEIRLRLSQIYDLEKNKDKE
jgi:hypothetical protein